MYLFDIMSKNLIVNYNDYSLIRNRSFTFMHTIYLRVFLI